MSGSRSVRLLVPLVFGMAIIVPPQSYLQVVEKLGYAGSYVDFWKLYITGYHGFCLKSDCLILPTIAAVLGFARRHLTHDSAARHYLTTAIFPVYIVHQTIIVVCAHSLQPAHLYPGVEGPLLVLVTATLSFMCYEVIRRVQWLRPLFGLAVERDAKAWPVRKVRPPVATLVPQDINQVSIK